MIALEEILRLGDESAGDTILFGSISQIAVNGRGDIIVAESDPMLIHTFGSDGTYLAPSRRARAGTGEVSIFFGPSHRACGFRVSVEIGDESDLYLCPDDFSWVRRNEVKHDGERQASEV